MSAKLSLLIALGLFPLVVALKAQPQSAQEASRLEAEAERLAELAEEREAEAASEEQRAESAERFAGMAEEHALDLEAEAEREERPSVRNVIRSLAAEARRDQAEHERTAAESRRKAAKLRGNHEEAMEQAQRAQAAAVAAAAAERKRATATNDNRSIQDELNKQVGNLLNSAGAGSSPTRDPEPGVNKTVIYEKGKEPKVIVHQEPPPNSTVIYEKGKEPRVETSASSAQSGSGGGLKPQTNTPGQKNGWDRTFFDDGRVQTEVYYVNGKKSGEFRRYAIRSLNEFRTPIHGHYFILESGQYENDQKTGEWKQWSTSAYLDKPYLEQSQWYSRGIKNGTRTRWDSDYFCGGRVHKTLEEEYVDDKLSGEQREFEHDCKLKMERMKRSTMYLNGKKNGPQIEYRNGVPHSTTSYIDGEKTGQ